MVCHKPSRLSAEMSEVTSTLLLMARPEQLYRAASRGEERILL